MAKTSIDDKVTRLERLLVSAERKIARLEDKTFEHSLHFLLLMDNSFSRAWIDNCSTFEKVDYHTGIKIYPTLQAFSMEPDLLFASFTTVEYKDILGSPIERIMLVNEVVENGGAVVFFAQCDNSTRKIPLKPNEVVELPKGTKTIRLYVELKRKSVAQAAPILKNWAIVW